MTDLQTTIAQVVGSQISLALKNHRADMKADFQEIQSSVIALSNKVDDISHKFTSVESRMDVVEDRINGIENRVQTLSDTTSTDINVNKVTDICVAEFSQRETRITPSFENQISNGTSCYSGVQELYQDAQGHSKINKDSQSHVYSGSYSNAAESIQRGQEAIGGTCFKRREES
ncbi:uncharacterized protein LOC122511952 [Leptopilina heterotoma]|uniref:uncharacterized protein LOC122511952 n=1 Tax=Leptopilina heterotoma TaxID=63436 RepID=UPI001CA864D9|nr:uncharacterized protein LOC122511952 [Leptopilina heterotoma]